MADNRSRMNENAFLKGKKEKDSVLKKESYDILTIASVLLVGLALLCTANRRRYQRNRRLNLLKEINSSEILFVQDGILYKEAVGFLFQRNNLKFKKITFDFDDCSVDEMMNDIWTSFINQTRYYNLSQHCSLKKASLYAVSDIVSIACPEFGKTESLQSYLRSEKGAELLKLKNCAWILNETQRCETDDDVSLFIEHHKKGLHGFARSEFVLCDKEEKSFLNYTTHQLGNASLLKGLVLTESALAFSALCCFGGGEIFEKPFLKMTSYSLFGGVMGTLCISEVLRSKHLKKQLRRFEKNNFVCEIIDSVGFETTSDETFFCEKVTRLTLKEIARVNSGCLKEIISLMDRVEPQTDLELSLLICNQLLAPVREEGRVMCFMNEGATLEESARSFGLKSVYSTMSYLSQACFWADSKTNDMSDLRRTLSFSYQTLQAFLNGARTQQEEAGIENLPIRLDNSVEQTDLTVKRRILLLKNKPLHPQTMKMVMRFKGD